RYRRLFETAQDGILIIDADTGHIIDVLLGKETDKTTRFGHDNLSVYGIGQEHNAKVWQSVARQLVAAGLVDVDHANYGALILTEEARAVFRGERRVPLRKDRAAASMKKTRGARSASLADDLDQDDRLLFERLRRLRTQLAREAEVPPYVVFPDATLAGIAKAASTEFGPTDEPVVGIITEWMGKDGLEQRAAGGDLGGTMRLGAYQAELSPNSHIAAIYGATSISERHRHRYEVNASYRDALESGGLIFSGMSPDGLLPEIVERPDHPWFVGVQFHPELKSKPFDPHPLFSGFIAASLQQARLV
ncbi:MAG: RQC domain-containing protein, partial [Novosphingobium sp.]